MGDLITAQSFLDSEVFCEHLMDDSIHIRACAVVVVVGDVHEMSLSVLSHELIASNDSRSLLQRLTGLRACSISGINENVSAT